MAICRHPPRLSTTRWIRTLREFDYDKPSIGDGKGSSGKGAGGDPFAGGNTLSEPTIVGPISDKLGTDVIGVIDPNGTRFNFDGGGKGLHDPTEGLREGKLKNPGVFGPGGTNPYAQRFGPQRAQSVLRNGGTTETEKAVLAALRWLKDHQLADGSWEGGYDAMPALATLCFFGHGETADSPEFGATITKAVLYLTSTVGSNGIIHQPNMYCQGAVTLALAEAYGMTQSPQVREPLDRAVSAIIASQKSAKTSKADIGGWRYSPESDTSDVSVSGWLIMGIKSARLAGISIDDEPFDKASKYLWNMYDPKGGFGYAGPAQGYATTAVGTLCQQFLGHYGDKRIHKALDFYKDKKADWSTGHGWNSLYAWYYITQAMFQGGGTYWEHWNGTIRRTLVDHQDPDGHWDVPGNDPKCQYGPVFSTTLCCLMLEVYYRYLPLYQEMERNTKTNPS